MLFAAGYPGWTGFARFCPREKPVLAAEIETEPKTSPLAEGEGDKAAESTELENPKQNHNSIFSIYYN